MTEKRKTKAPKKQNGKLRVNEDIKAGAASSALSASGLSASGLSANALKATKAGTKSQCW